MDRWKDNPVANARLLGAAPDLMEAVTLARSCFKVTEIILGDYGLGLLYGKDVNSFYECQSRLERAYLKAGGQDPDPKQLLNDEIRAAQD